MLENGDFFLLVTLSKGHHFLVGRYFRRGGGGEGLLLLGLNRKVKSKCYFHYFQGGGDIAFRGLWYFKNLHVSTWWSIKDNVIAIYSMDKFVFFVYRSLCLFQQWITQRYFSFCACLINGMNN